jgi:hypothetical protein
MQEGGIDSIDRIGAGLVIDTDADLISRQKIGAADRMELPPRLPIRAD